MKQRVLLLTRILAVISIILLVFAFSTYAEENTTENSVDILYVEEITDSVGTALVHEELASESLLLFTGILPFDAETITIIADSNTAYEVNAATPLGRLAIAALEGDGFEYIVSDELFESDGILTLVSIGDYVNGENGTWKAYEEAYDSGKRIADNEVNTRLIADTVIFAYGTENERAIVFVEILAEPLIDEINIETVSTAELDEQ